MCLHKRPEDWNETSQTTSSRPRIQESKPSAAVKLDASPKAVTESKDSKTVTTLSTKQIDTTDNLSMVLPVYISTYSGNRTLVYAMLDTQSDTCFISEKVASLLKPEVEEETVTISTMTGTCTEKLNKYTNLKIQGYYEDNSTIITAYGREDIPCDYNNIPNRVNTQHAGHLKDVRNLLAPKIDAPIGLLIGTSCPEGLAPIESVLGQPGEPFAIRTLLGWTVCGRQERNNEVQRTNLGIKVSVNTTMMGILKRDMECLQHADEEILISQDDFKFLDIMKKETRQLENKFYQMPLPFRQRPVLLNNIGQATKRLTSLTKRLASDPKLEEEYATFMKNLVKDGHAEEVPKEKLSKPGEVWYIPHFHVTHPQKKKIRIVFDCSAKYAGTSLNDHLLQGPDHINSLVGILVRFRKEHVGISCDIEKMFYNFQVDKKDRDYLRFLWIDDGEIKHYRMNVHLFGATSSPAVATYGLRKLAEDYKDDSQDAADFICRNFYVDDGLISVNTEREASNLIQNTIQMCQKGNLRLHKFASNSKQVLADLPQTETKVNNLDLFGDQRTLGLIWSLDKDVIRFSDKMELQPCTRRGVLSTVAQLYDPIGFLAPFVLTGKNILQRANQLGLDWDKELDMELRAHWYIWFNQLKDLNKLEIPRCLKPQDFGDIKRAELHYFSDASFNGYGTCSYIRLVNNQDRVHCSLLMAKARVAPPKGATTIPRLELQAATVATRLNSILEKELDMPIDEKYFWTDSEIVLSYLNNDTKRFHMFVANRVYEIKNKTATYQWNHIPTQENPADLASRGTTVTNLISSSWFQGPKFLWNLDISNYLNRHSQPKDLDESDPEVRKIKVMTTSATKDTSLVNRFSKISSWKSLLRTVAILKRRAKLATQASKQLRNNTKTTIKTTEQLKPDDLREAEEYIIKAVQTESYPKMENETSLRKLNPQLDSKGILRLGGRANAAQGLDILQKHPIIIPKTSHIANLITLHYHEKIFHLGHRSTLATIRDAGYWVVNGNSIVKSMINRCVSCARIRKGTENQLMGHLPQERLENTPPFTHIGMDVFGHYLVKDRRTEIKRWGLLLSCLYSRAIHVEILEDMSTDALINALRRFMAIRGSVSTIYCDNGTNFVGAKNEFQQQIELSSDDIKNYLLDHQIDFKFNAPGASHQGGAWERMIRSVRATLSGMALKYKSRLTTETLRTAFYEAASIVNSRPLTATDINNPTETLITPNHLLTRKTKQLAAPPPGDFKNEEIYGKAQWKKAQQFAQEFWVA